MFPAVYNANFRIVQAPGVVAITYELIHDTRIIPIDPSPPRARRRSRRRSARTWATPAATGKGSTLVVETTNLKANTRGSSQALRLIERFARTNRDTIEYQVTFIDPRRGRRRGQRRSTLKARTDDAGVFEYACHEGNHGMRYMLEASRLADRVSGGR